MPCPLCDHPTARAVRGADDRRYFLCAGCALIYVDPVQHLSLEQERAYYATHENSIDDAGYVRFLMQIVEPLAPLLSADMRGLDYGCGPGPTLSILLQRCGFVCEDYDPLFADRALTPPYDFIASTECFEHFRKPAAEIARIHALLRPGGWLGVMTQCWTTLDGFAASGYTRDPTHVAFYHSATLERLCSQFGFAMHWTDARRVAIFRRL